MEVKMYRAILTTPEEKARIERRRKHKIACEIMDELGRERELLELNEAYEFMYKEMLEDIEAKKNEPLIRDLDRFHGK
jgi:hypothetical protein